LYEIRGKMHKELGKGGEDDEVAEGSPSDQEDGRGTDKGYHISLFVAVEGRGDKEPDLIEDNGRGGEYTGEEADLHIGEKGLGRGSEDHRRPRGQGPL